MTAPAEAEAPVRAWLCCLAECRPTAACATSCRWVDITAPAPPVDTEDRKDRRVQKGQPR